MSRPVDYALLDALLADESLSLRQCADRAGCSDWSARQRYRRLCGDDRPMKTPSVQRNAATPENSEPPESLTAAEAVIAWGIAAAFFIGLIAWSRYSGRNGLPPYRPPEEPMT
jgi:hypothetical protein